MLDGLPVKERCKRCKFAVSIWVLMVSVIVAQSFATLIQPALAQSLSSPLDFSLKDVGSGRVIRLYDYSNKVILLNFMTTWCPWDAKEFDYVLVPLYERGYKDDTDVVFLSIHLDPDKGPEIRSYAKEHNINWPILEGGKWSVSKVAKDYGVDAVPMTFILKFFGSTREIVYQKRGHNPENLYEFGEVIENVRREILADLGKGKTEPPEQVTNLFSFQYVAQLPNGNSVKLNYSTTSEVMKTLTHNVDNSMLTLQVNERYEFAHYYETGFLIMSMPKEFLEAYKSSIDKIVVTVNGKEPDRIYVKYGEDGCIVRVEYGYGDQNIKVFYQSFSLTIHVQSVFGLPVSDALAVLEWPDGQVFSELAVSSSGKATFQKVPGLSTPYTVYIKHGLLSFQFVPQEILINQDSKITFTSYIYYDTLFAFMLFFITSIVVLKIEKRRKAIGKENTSLNMSEPQGGEVYV
ncbi:MAG: TlpA disulfide reductase family protein [Candidatus Bathyarchaeia archaeon]|nr:TlpA disulfide reductase family protein [Candidatus Bathyarchaeia archaeon]